MNLSDAAIAEILANQASKPRSLTELSRHYAPISALSEPVTVNKTFLARTIRNVDSHNRREEEDSCWRTHLLQKQIGRKRGRDESEENDQRFEDDRSEWAKKKLQAFAGDKAHSSSSSSDETESRDEEERRKKKHKKEQKKAKKHGKKTKKEKKKHDKKSKKKRKEKHSDTEVP